MKFIVSSLALKTMLAPLKLAINQSTVLPILTHVLFEADIAGGYLILTTTNLETVVQVRVSASFNPELTGPPVFCVDYKRLMEFLQATPDQPLSFSLDKNNVLTIVGDNITTTQVVEDANNYPKVPEVRGDMLHLQRDTLDVIKSALKFVSTDDLRPSMTGLLLETRDQKLWVVGTDAHRLYWKDIALEPIALAVAGRKLSVIFPVTIWAVLNTVKHKQDYKLTIQEAEGKSYGKVEMGTYTVITRLIDARFPDYTAVLPKEMPFSFKMIRKDLSRFIRMVKPFSNSTTHQGKFSMVKDTHIKFEGQDVDYSSSAVVTMPVYDATDHLPVEFALNLEFLRQALTISDDEYVFIESTGSATKCVVLDGRLLLMPLRV